MTASVQVPLDEVIKLHQEAGCGIQSNMHAYVANAEFADRLVLPWLIASSFTITHGDDALEDCVVSFHALHPEEDDEGNEWYRQVKISVSDMRGAVEKLLLAPEHLVTEKGDSRYHVARYRTRCEQVGFEAALEQGARGLLMMGQAIFQMVAFGEVIYPLVNPPKYPENEKQKRKREKREEEQARREEEERQEKERQKSERENSEQDDQEKEDSDSDSSDDSSEPNEPNESGDQEGGDGDGEPEEGSESEGGDASEGSESPELRSKVDKYGNIHYYVKVDRGRESYKDRMERELRELLRESKRTADSFNRFAKTYDK